MDMLISTLKKSLDVIPHSNVVFITTEERIQSDDIKDTAVIIRRTENIKCMMYDNKSVCGKRSTTNEFISLVERNQYKAYQPTGGPITGGGVELIVCDGGETSYTVNGVRMDHIGDCYLMRNGRYFASLPPYTRDSSVNKCFRSISANIITDIRIG